MSTVAPSIVAAVRRERRNPDRGIDRCPSCGAFRYLQQCWTPLDTCRRYPSDLYDTELVEGAGWDRMEIATATGQGGEWQERTEVIWSNRALNTQQAFDLEETAS